MQNYKVGTSEKVRKIQKALNQFAEQYAALVHEGGGKIEASKIAGEFYLFFNGRPLVQEKIQLNVVIRKCFRNYLEGKHGKVVQKGLKSLDTDIFIDVISNFWENYQRFTFAFDFITKKGDIFFQTYNQNQRYAHITDGSTNQVARVPIISVNQMKKFMEKLNIVDRYSQIFCNAIASQRDGKAVQSQKIRSAMQFFQASQYDFDAIIKLGEGNKPMIKKQRNQATKNALTRHSKADQFFDNYMMTDLLQKCEKFYRKFVTYQAINLSAPEELTLMIEYIHNEESRGHNYIHEQRNFDKYIKCVNQNLILFKMEERIKKQSGLSRFLDQFDPSKNEFKEELEKFWTIYSRVFSDAKDLISQIYNEYFQRQGKNLLQLMEKGVDFINSCVNLNKKNRQIVNIMGNMLDLDRIRVQSIEKILSSQMIKGNKYQGKYFLGAKHLSAVLNMKIKSKYSKDEKYGEDESDILGLFKIFKYKTVAIKQHTKFLNLRLLEDLDISKDAQFINAIQLQQRVIEQIRKQSSENDVKTPQQCIKDITRSQQTTNKLKSKGFTKKFPFLNQVIIKNNTFWNQSTFFDIQPPVILQKCIIDITKQLESNASVQFQLFNGVSTIRYSVGPNKFNFNIKNIYVIILLMIDERPNKKMFYSEIRDRVKPSGRLIDKAYLELSKYLIELVHFGLLKSNKNIKPGAVDIEKCEGSDWFQINKEFKPLKKLPVYKTNLLNVLPDHIKKPFIAKTKLLDEQQKQYEKDRKLYVQSHCVKVLKHAHHNGGATVSLEELLQYFSKGKQRQLNVTSAKYLKEIIENLINKQYCERVEGKKNTFKYTA